MSQSPLLTIIVPTYNRARCLELLLRTLVREVDGLQERVRIMVSDNASTDDTPDVVRAFSQLVPAAVTIRHPENVGADENFCRCVERADTPYFWMIGDDDLPRAAAIAHVLAMVDDYRPDLVYLESDWRAVLVDNAPDSPVSDAAPILLSRLGFARRVNVWTTFIASLVVRRDSFVAGQGPAALRRFVGTNLTQLAWVLGTLRLGNRFLATRQPYVLATQGDTGGYSVLTVFGVNFERVVSQVFGRGSAMARAILRRNTVMFLPSLLWSLRFGNVGDFAVESIDSALRPALGGRLSYWVLLRPTSRWPRRAAAVLMRMVGVVSKLIRLHDRMLARLGAPRRPA